MVYPLGAVYLVHCARMVAVSPTGVMDGGVKANGSEWALSVPFVNAAVSVNWGLSFFNDTVQSSDVAREPCV